jgi:tricorn protease
MPPGYYRFPTLHNNTVVFVCEDDLWTVPTAGGIPRRLTSNLGEATRPLLSPDGERLAFVGREEGQAEIYFMPALGGQAERQTYLGGTFCNTAAWMSDGTLYFASNAGHWEAGFTQLYTIRPGEGAAGRQPERVNLGLARSIAFGPGGALVLGRHTGDPARWKRYRGGMTGQLWIDSRGSGEFESFLQEKLGNLSSPMWLYPAGGAEVSGNGTGRIYFISDHEGVGNLYSCLPTGEDLRRHTENERYYVRNASTDGRRIIYHAGADLFLYDPETDRTHLIPIEFHSPQTQRNRKFVNPERYLESWKLHPKGHSVAVTVRGKAFTFANWEGAVIPHGPSDAEGRNGQQDPAAPSTAVRVRLPHWLHDGERFIAVSDAGGEEAFVIFNARKETDPDQLENLDIGRPENIVCNPQKDQIVFSNHRYELLFLDLNSRELRVIDRGKAYMNEKGITRPISGFDWSPDGEWVVYSVSQSLQTNILMLWQASTGDSYQITEPILRDIAPSFDPHGRFIYFLSYRHFDPVYDNLHFDLNFPRGMKPYLLSLQDDTPSPFIPRLKEEKNIGEKPQEAPEDAQTGAEPEEKKPSPQVKDEAEGDKIRIDLEGIRRRILAFPVADGVYGRVLGTREGKVLYSRYPVEGQLSQNHYGHEPPANGNLFMYNFDEQKEEALLSSITDFDLSMGGATLIARSGNRLRVLKAGEKPDDRANSTPGRKSGWIDLSRVKISVLPGAEWRQMFREAWRLQRDQFWSPDMSEVDWLSIHDRYLPLVDRVSSRSEFSDLMWEMQGELGTSHAYEYGGDYRPGPNYGLGFLGADFEFDPEVNGWRIMHIVKGDSWDPQADSPLNSPGLKLSTGDVLVAVNGRRLSREISPAYCLVNHAGDEVILEVAFEPTSGSVTGYETPAKHGGRIVTVKTLRSESQARYREWVEENRRKVHEATDGRAGYIHIPDMGAGGYAEFHRGYLAEVDREGLIVDVRFNHGGHVSWLLLEKLARRRIGYDLSRWSTLPVPYPLESVAGPMVAVTNELAGSDGDIFSHGFKMLKLGPLVGKRTWGGVIGIEPRHALVDGTITTQPEFSFWFSDVGWQVENFGTEPDIEVDITPQDYARGTDNQLERSIQEILTLLENSPSRPPEFGPRPSRALPKIN